MTKILRDKRLPKGFTVFHNYFDEFVCCNPSGKVARINDKNVRASRTKENAVIYYLNGLTTNGEVI